MKKIGATAVLVAAGIAGSGLGLGQTASAAANPVELTSIRLDVTSVGESSVFGRGIGLANDGIWNQLVIDGWRPKATTTGQLTVPESDTLRHLANRSALAQEAAETLEAPTCQTETQTYTLTVGSTKVTSQVCEGQLPKSPKTPTANSIIRLLDDASHRPDLPGAVDVSLRFQNYFMPTADIYSIDRHGNWTYRHVREAEPRVTSGRLEYQTSQQLQRLVTSPQFAQEATVTAGLNICRNGDGGYSLAAGEIEIGRSQTCDVGLAAMPTVSQAIDLIRNSAH
jgi:hypothetical protein